MFQKIWCRFYIRKNFTNSKNWSLNKILIVNACFQEFPKQPVDLAPECAWLKQEFCLSTFVNTKSCSKQDSCLSQALLLGLSKHLAWIKQDSCLRALVNTGPAKFEIV